MFESAEEAAGAGWQEGGGEVREEELQEEEEKQIGEVEAQEKEKSKGEKEKVVKKGVGKYLSVIIMTFFCSIKFVFVNTIFFVKATFHLK